MSSNTPAPAGARALQAAIIDLDGTLVDTLADFDVALNAVLAELRLSALTAAQIEPMVGKGSEHLVRSALHAAGGDAGLFRPAWEAYLRHYAAVNGVHARVYPGVVEGLARLRAAGLRLACVTNKPAAFARELLARKDLARWFEAIRGGDEFARKKPDPMPFAQTCAELGVPPAQALVVGDSVNDALAARAAGCRVVLVSYGYNHGQPVREVDADGWVDTLANVPLGS